MSRKLLLISLFLVTIVSFSKAQLVGGGIGADSLTSTFLPVASYLSNEGLIGGVVYNRNNYRGDAEPFHNSLESRALVSTRGYIRVEGKFEQTRIFGPNDRSILEGCFHHFKADNFFGIGNEVSFNKGRWKEEYYYFESLSVGLDYKFRQPLYTDPDRQFDMLAGIGAEYHIPYIRNDNSSFAAQMPNGITGGLIPYISTGFIWENRDNEFDPHHGNRAEFGFRFSPDLLSDYAITSAHLEMSQFFYLFDFLTVANKLDARHVGGNVPFWEMSTLGNRQTLRGYPLNRFQGNTLLAYSLELRAWFFQFPQFFDLKFGGQLFTDVGRVFTAKDDFNDLFSGYKQTVGIGGALSVINPDFIVVGAIGFSQDISRTYLGIGYLF